MSINSRLDQLLRQAGFNEDPFGLREVDREGRDRLDGYFFQHPLFREVLGNANSPETVILMAQRGAGKTTLRQAIELQCRKRRPPVDGVLDVAYVDFSNP